MARPLRLDVAGGYYHVFSRGIERRVIFPGDVDREDFLGRLKELPTRFGLEIHAYVLMDNHYHLLLRPKNLNLSQAIQWLNVGYSIWFNKKHGRVGPLFQGRFKSILVGDEVQLTEITRYLHLNPVRIRSFGLDVASRKRLEKGLGESPARETIRAAIEHLNGYRWSSYRAYTRRTVKPGWLHTDLSEGMGPKEYRRYTEQGIRIGMPSNPFTENLIEGYLGSKEQLRELKQKLKKLRGNRSEQKGVRQLEAMVPWEAIVKAVEKTEGMPWDELCLIRGNSGRDLGLILGRRCGGLSLGELGKRAGGMSYAAVAQAVNRMEQRIESDKNMKEKLTRLTRMSNVKT